ncbi:Signal transduction histidine kinase [Sporobacter termitidis DSM 10068]|uniref:histidine kinase n=1 Tax=Sporobacter termitidis DSM 10068 TaxID=1123282 RepID=A0A1M5YS24_9FIRM|nr:HAMP domain-containing sensor histidine kinase [Sporobacter termitidis]SHI14876.1 Signal transduction histidine kinase [Sporobacter termitidis DSM 10068]
MKIKQWTHYFLAKTIAFFLLIIMACTAVGSVFAGSLFVQENFYTRSIAEIKEGYFSGPAQSAAGSVLHYLKIGDAQAAQKYCERDNISAEVLSKDGSELWSNYDGAQTDWQFAFEYNVDTTEDARIPAGTYIIRIYLDDTFQKQNEYSFINSLVSSGFALRYWIYPIGILALILTIASFIFLMCSAGHRVGREAITGIGLAIPFDLLTGILVLAVYVAYFLYRDIGVYDDVYAIAALAAGLVGALVAFTAYCMSFAARIKLGGWWKTTVICWLIRLIIRICKAIGRAFVSLMHNLPLIWKTALLTIIISGIELFGIIVCFYETDNLLILWFLEKMLLIPVALYLAIILRRLQKGGQALAQGDLSYQVDTKRMLWDFKRHGENLNSIALGMTRAVDDRLKSERFKTELITNVSHDIKTPLTSIINYSDLICKEQTENKKVAEYAKVLFRQSERLKKLIEDLVEASKASTGNIDVLLAPCEAGVLLTQTAGEYEQRLRENDLELITKQPENPIKIMADGRRLWRVFDNLMNNICKYAQSGTRVYLNVEKVNDDAVISFKNTSKYPLDISTDELMERFVRGDSARNTDGNGLGLSISKSLTELQNGKLELTVDGDLFKVILRFKCIP